MLEKARGLSCDVAVLDLEDSVAPEAKDAARAVCAALKDFIEGAVRLSPNAPCGKRLKPWSASTR